MIKPKKTIDAINPYETDFYKNNWRLKLDSNENIYGCSQSIISAIKNFNFEDISLYPCYGKLIDKLSQKYNLDNENILLTNGCDEALSIVINTYLDDGDEILSYNPSFSMPQLYAKITGGKVKLVDYDEKFVFSEKTIRENISQKTKIVYIATPNNPTGELARASAIEHLASSYKDILFIVDCTYINFSYNAVFEDYSDLIKTCDNIVVVKSFSKDFALAGLRIGFAIADSGIIANLKKTASPYNVNAIAVNCAIMALNEEKKFDEIKELNKNAKNLLIEGLQNLGYKPYPSEANFVLCDFYSHSDFFYEKLKKNGVIVRKFSKNSPLSTCLRITVPKLGGVKFVLELLNKKDLIIFDLDGVVFDVRNSYLSAIIETVKHYSGTTITQKDVAEVKNLGGMNCDWDAAKCLLDRLGYNIDIADVINVFQDLFYNPSDKSKQYLIDREELLISPEIFEELSQKYDFAVFSGRLKEEALYSLEKFGIDKYFSYYITCDDLPKTMLKPHPRGVLEILEHCPHKTVKYFGDSVDDIIAGNSANVKTIGVISPGADYNTMINNFRHLGAKHILDDIKNIVNFLGEIEEDYAKNL